MPPVPEFHRPKSAALPVFLAFHDLTPAYTESRLNPSFTEVVRWFDRGSDLGFTCGFKIYELQDISVTALQKLRRLDRTTAGVGIPKDDLVVDGLADPEADGLRLLETPIFQVDRIEPGRYEIRVCNPDEFGPGDRTEPSD